MDRSRGLRSPKGVVIIAAGWLFAALLGVISCSSSTEQDQTADKSQSLPLFATWNGLGPDKWASIWLVQRHIHPGARVILLPENTDGAGLIPADTVFFDIPGSSYLRNTDTSTFAQLRASFAVDEETVQWVSRVVHDIDINLWMPDQEPVSMVVENAFRQLQNRYGRDRVPYECYMAFFDKVAGLAGSTAAPASLVEEDLIPADSCGKGMIAASQDAEALVPEIPIADLFDAMRTGAKVVFIDVRETQEYEEFHIPSARNIKIRDADKALAESLADADLVVSYCVKDFRGFEMAKKLRTLGVNQSVILKPYGIKGWLSAGLPVAQGGSPESSALAEAQLSDCISRKGSCKAAL